MKCVKTKYGKWHMVDNSCQELNYTHCGIGYDGYEFESRKLPTCKTCLKILKSMRKNIIRKLPK